MQVKNSKIDVKTDISRRNAMGALGVAAAIAALPTTPANAARPSSAGSRASHALPVGHSYWLPEISPQGPVVTVVNLHSQHVQVYRNGIAVGYSSTSTGKQGHGTPKGLFRILEKRRHHRSSTYNNAPMPWMMRLTWRGIAFHEGPLPGYPASHGCIRLPRNFAPQIFSIMSRGDVVAVLRQAPEIHTTALNALSPITPDGKPTLISEMLTGDYAGGEIDNQQSISLLASLAQNRLFILQNGRVIASTSLPQKAKELQNIWNDNPIFTWEGKWSAPEQIIEDEQVWQALIPAHLKQQLQTVQNGTTLYITPQVAVGDAHIAAWGLGDKFLT